MRGLLSIAYDALTALILVNAILSWMPEAARSPFGRAVRTLTEPLLAPLRKLIPPVRMGRSGYLDLSPLVFLVALNIVYHVLVRILP